MGFDDRRVRGGCVSCDDDLNEPIFFEWRTKHTVSEVHDPLFEVPVPCPYYSGQLPTWSIFPAVREYCSPTPPSASPHLFQSPLSPTCNEKPGEQDLPGSILESNPTWG